jgi:hypothetical protein
VFPLQKINSKRRDSNMKRWKSLIVIFAVFVVYKGQRTQGERTHDECVIRANEPDTTSANPELGGGYGFTPRHNFLHSTKQYF